MLNVMGRLLVVGLLFFAVGCGGKGEKKEADEKIEASKEEAKKAVEEGKADEAAPAAEGEKKEEAAPAAEGEKKE